MARRLPKIVALAAILLLTMPTAAFADYSVSLEGPENGIVKGKTEIQIRVARDRLDVAVTGLQVRPVGGSGNEWRQTTCKSGCETSDRRSVYAFTLEPRTGAPFGNGIMRNGTFEFEARATRAFRQDPVDLGRLQLILNVPGSAVGGLAASVDGDDVRLAWSRAPEPDIEGYRVERCAGTCDGSGSWSAQGTTAASASSYTDQPGAGTHSYRVVTVRSGGRDGSIETFSSPVTAEVVPPPPSATPDGQTPGSGDGDGGAGDGSSDPESRNSNGDRSPRSGDAPDLGDGSTPGPTASPSTAPGSSTSRSSGIRSGRAPSVSLGRGSAGIPELPGIGDIFRGELDYSADDPQAASGGNGRGGNGEEGDEVVLGAPGGGSGSFIGQLTDPNRIAVPIAGGLLMTAIGLHLWRWLRIPLT